MALDLKSLKVLKISSKGCVNFDRLVYLKTYKKQTFYKQTLFFDLLNIKKVKNSHFNFFYKKYRN